MTAEQIERHIRWAVGFAWLVAGLDAIVWLATLAGISLPFGWSTGLDALIYGVLAWGVARRNRLAAVVLPTYWVVSKVSLWLRFRKIGAFVGLVVLGYFFLRGARAVFKAHGNRTRLNEISDAAP